MWGVIAVQLAAFVALPYVYYNSVEINGRSLALETCKGQTNLMLEVLTEYKGITEGQKASALFSQLFTILSTTSLFLAEMACYIIMFIYLFRHDKSALKKGILTKDYVTKRNKTNTLTLTGQAIVSVMEILLGFIGGSTMNLGKAFGLDRTDFPIVIIVLSAGISVATFMTSPELRRHFSQKKA